jgi:hypothetical protein
MTKDDVVVGFVGLGIMGGRDRPESHEFGWTGC